MKGRFLVALDYELLRALHHKLKLQTEFRSQIERGPRKIKLAKSTEQKLADELEAAKEALLKSRMLADEKQLQLSEREAKIEDLKGKRNACESNREYQLLNDQIAADEQANSVLSDEILELLERIDQLETDLDTAKTNHAKAQEETKNSIGKIEKDLVIQKAELAAVEEEIGNFESKLPSEIRTDYRRQINAKQDDALAFSDKETCGNCNQRLNPQTISDLMMQKPVFCKACGSLMYINTASTANS